MANDPVLIAYAAKRSKTGKRTVSTLCRSMTLSFSSSSTMSMTAG